MAVKIYYPRLLIVTLLLILGISSTSVIMAKDSNPAGNDVPQAIITPKLDPEDKVAKEALSVIDESGIVDAISESQEWTPIDIYETQLSKTKAVLVTLSWQKPVSSRGPWKSILCQNTWQVEIADPFSNVTHLAVYVDMVNKKVVGHAPTSPDDIAGGIKDEYIPVAEPLDAKATKVFVYDFATEEYLFEGNLADLREKSCPAGLEDD